METVKIKLRKLEISDMEDLIENANDKELSFLTYYIPYPFGKNEAEKIILEEKTHSDLFRFGIFLKSEKKIVGIVDLYNLKKKEGKIKLGYWIGKKYRKRGYTSDAVSEAIKFAFEKLDVKTISAKVLAINHPSIKFLEKFNFKAIKTTPNDKFLDGKKLDTISYELKKEDFNHK